MQLDDLVVEVRDRSLQRVGQIDHRFLTDSVFSPRANGVGTWQVKLPASVDGVPYELATALRTEGAGIIVTGPHGVVMSGPTVAPDNEATTEAPEGVWTINGVSDSVLIRDALAYPDPAVADPTTQTKANDVRTGRAETILRAFVSANIADLAPSGRRRGFRTAIHLGGIDHMLGPVLTKSPRFQNLLELCQEIAASTRLLFDIVQNGDRLEFLTWEAADLTQELRMDIENDQLRSTSWGYTLPDLTVPIVAGQGEGTERTIITRTSAAAVAAEAAWGRPIEEFIDQRQTDDLTELQQKGDTALSEALAGTDTLTVVPSDDLAATYGLTWTTGALVSVVVGTEEVPARINQAVIAVTAEGLLLGCVIGDADGTDWEGQVNRSITSLRSRVSSLERNSGSLSAADWGGKAGPSAYVSPYKTRWTKGIDGGGSVDANTSTDGVRITADGIYEVVGGIRVTAAAAFAALALNGDRDALESRANGLYTHDHGSSPEGYSNSRYLGRLMADELITLGTTDSGVALAYRPGSVSGFLQVRRIA